MAQTKADSTRSKSSQSRATGTTSRSANSKSRDGANAQSRRSTSGSSRSGGAASKTASRNGTERSKLAKFADKAKTPAAAGGAALVGLAGGLALSRNKRRKGVIGRIGKPNVKLPKVKAPKMSMPKPDSALKAVSHAAGEVAERSHRVGQVASGVQMASDAITNSKRG